VYCKGCGTSIERDARFCRQCGTPTIAAGSRITRHSVRLLTPEEQTVGLSSPPPAEPFDSGDLDLSVAPSPSGDLEAEPDRAPEDVSAAAPAPRFEHPVPAAPEARPRHFKLVVGLLAATWLAVLAALVGAGLYVAGMTNWGPGGAIVERLEAAVAQDSFFEPPGGSAYDLYLAAKAAGVDATSLAPVERTLLEKLPQQPAAMMAAMREPGAKDPGVEAWVKAERMMRWASEIAPQDQALAARAAYCGGRVAYLRRDREVALEAYRRAAELDPTWALPANGAGLILSERKEYPAGREFLLEAVRRDPEWAIPYNSIGTSYLFEDNLDEAERNYRRAAELDPDWPRPHVWLGDIAARRGDRAAAVAEYEAALALDSVESPSVDQARVRQKLEAARRGTAAKPAAR
jgi:tetratricopeptide (TPR) repeat protein